jgi:hypothetical protein
MLETGAKKRMFYFATEAGTDEKLIPEIMTHWPVSGHQSAGGRNRYQKLASLSLALDNCCLETTLYQHAS